MILEQVFKAVGSGAEITLEGFQLKVPVPDVLLQAVFMRENSEAFFALVNFLGVVVDFG